MKTPSTEEKPEQQAALHNLVVNCPELRELEQRMGSFNIFRVLRSEFAEIRHSNVLAWLLQPEESHGLRDLFLRRWFMQVFHDSKSKEAPKLDPVDIATCTILSVKVNREWKYLDVLVQIETLKEGTWVFAIENKVKARQRNQQLSDYRGRVEKRFTNQEKLFYIFLTNSGEPPEDRVWISASYKCLNEVLSDCLKEQRGTIGRDSLILVQHYLRILKEQFMKNSKIAKLARKIYVQHKDAMDLILDHRHADWEQLTESLDSLMRQSTEPNKIIPKKIEGRYVHFFPKAWDTAENRKGRAWGDENESAFILCEIDLEQSPPRFVIVQSQGPEEWRNKLWKLSEKEEFQNRTWDDKDKEWMIVYSATYPDEIVLEAEYEYEELAGKIWKWCVKQMGEKMFENAVQVIAEHLDSLKLGNVPPNAPHRKQRVK